MMNLKHGKPLNFQRWLDDNAHKLRPPVGNQQSAQKASMNYSMLCLYLVSGRADVIAATKSALLERAASQPGSRVLDGRFLVEPVGMGVPKGVSPSLLRASASSSRKQKRPTWSSPRLTEPACVA